MACEKYSGSLTNLALGELHPQRERELLAHAGECGACREAFNHAKAVAAAVDRSVESLVAGQPSPQFAARLRARLTEERVPAPARWVAWAPAAAGALALVGLLVILMVRSPQRDGRGPAALESRANHFPSPLAQVPPKSLPSVSRPQNASQSSPYWTHPPRAVAVKIPQPEIPEILVPQGELAMALRFSEALVSGRVNGEQLLASQDEITKPLEVKPLEISPLETPKPIAPAASAENSGRR